MSSSIENPSSWCEQSVMVWQEGIIYRWDMSTVKPGSIDAVRDGIQMDHAARAKRFEPTVFE